MQEAISGKKNIDYFGIIKKSWQITWENKILWWFGLLASLGGGINLSMPLNGSDFKDDKLEQQIIWEDIVGFFDKYSTWIIIGASLLLGLIILFSVLKIFGRIGLINSVDKITKGKGIIISNEFREGKVFFWKIFLTDLLVGVIIFMITIILFLPVGYLFYLKALPAAFLSLFLALVIFLALAVITAIMRTYIFIYIILGRISVREAIENAYKVYSEHTLSSIMMLLAIMLVGILFGIVIAVAIIVLVLFCALLGGVLFWLFGKIGIFCAVALGLLALIPSLFLIRSMQETLAQTAWILFLKEIAEIKDEEMIPEANLEKIGEKITDPEVV